MWLFSLTCSSLCFHCCHPSEGILWSPDAGVRSSLAIPDSVIQGGGAQDFWGIFLKARLRSWQKERFEINPDTDPWCKYYCNYNGTVAVLMFMSLLWPSAHWQRSSQTSQVIRSKSGEGISLVSACVPLWFLSVGSLLSLGGLVGLCNVNRTATYNYFHCRLIWQLFPQKK